jgi:manganese/iron transport system ATP-binding protein/manganese/zinc/iron transport system ATP- binding protein
MIDLTDRVVLVTGAGGGIGAATARTVARAGGHVVLHELRAEGRVLLVATHDARQARAWQRVLCLNGTQVAFGEPADVLTPAVLQATYGGELVVLADGSTAVAVEHHEH